MCADLGGGTNLGSVTISDISGVASGSGLGGCKRIWGLYTLRGIVNPNPTFYDSAACTLRFYLGGRVGGFSGGCC